jgi:hypothetical protein
MARDAESREDLMRDATALVERVEFGGAGNSPLIVGFRRDGCASFYFGEDPAYHFNTQGQLRRAFLAGELYTAEQGRLVRLRRERGGGEVALVRHEFSDQEQAAPLSALEQRLSAVRTSLEHGQLSVVRQVPADFDPRARILHWFASLSWPIAVATAPHAR